MVVGGEGALEECVCVDKIKKDLTVFGKVGTLAA